MGGYRTRAGLVARLALLAAAVSFSTAGPAPGCRSTDAVTSD